MNIKHFTSAKKLEIESGSSCDSSSEEFEDKFSKYLEKSKCKIEGERLKISVIQPIYSDEEFILVPEYVLKTEKFLRWVKQ
jgi:hypothetical protein